MTSNRRLRIIAEIHRSRAQETNAEAALVVEHRRSRQFEDAVRERDRPRQLVENSRLERASAVFEHRRAIDSIKSIHLSTD